MAGTQIMNNSLGLIDPLLPYNFKLQIVGNVADRFLKNGEEFTFRAESTNLPGYKQEQHTQTFANSRLVYHGRTFLKNNVWNVSLKESSELYIHNAIYEWMLLAHDPNTGKGMSTRDVAADAVLTIYNSAQEETGKFKLLRIFPIDLPDITFNTAENGSPVVSQIQFSVNWIEPMK